MIEAIRSRDLAAQTKRRVRSVGQEASKGLAFIERSWYLTKRYAWWELVWVTYNVVNALSVTFIAAAAEKITPQIHLTQQELNELVMWLIIGTSIWSFVSVVFDNVTETVTIERWEGTIEYTFMAPVSRLTHMLGMCIFAVVHGLILTIIQLFVVSMFFHLDISHANWGASIVLLVLGSVSFIGLGTMGAVLPLLYTERGAQMTYVISSGLLLVSGVYYPVSVLPGWMQVIGTVSPANYALDSIRGAVMSGRSVVDLWPSIWPLLLIGAVTIPLGLAVFQRAERYAKRTGKLKRSG